MLKKIVKRFKSPVVLLGMFGIIISVSGISPENITSWQILLENLKQIFLNPFILISITVQIFAFLNNPSDSKKF